MQSFTNITGQTALTHITCNFYEVSHDRRKELITGCNRDGETGGWKQDQEIYTNRLRIYWDRFFCIFVRHDRSEKVWGLELHDLSLEDLP